MKATSKNKYSSCISFIKTLFLRVFQRQKCHEIEHKHLPNARWNELFADRQFEDAVPALNIIWDGEFFQIDGKDEIRKVVSVHPFLLPGGSECETEPFRIVASLLREVGALDLIDSSDQLVALKDMMDKGVDSPITSKLNSFFDGISSLLNVCTISEKIGDASQRLESLSKEVLASDKKLYISPYPYSFYQIGEVEVFDWRPMVYEIIEDFLSGRDIAEIGYTLHITIVDMAVEVARKLELSNVIISSDIFKNDLLSKLAHNRFKREGKKVFWRDMPKESNEEVLDIGKKQVVFTT